MWVCDFKTLQFLGVNRAAVQHYGYSREEFLRMSVADIRLTEEAPRLPADPAGTRIGVDCEYRHRLKNGGVIDLESASHNLAFGGREAQLVVVRDITKQKQAEQALQQAERKYRLIFEEAIVDIYRSTPEGRLLSANPAMARMCGFDSAEEMMACIADVQPQLYVDPTRREDFKRLMREQGVVRHFEMQIYRKDGNKMWLWTNARAVREGDTIVRYEGTFEELTDRKLLEEQLREAQQDYCYIVENAVAGIFQSTRRVGRRNCTSSRSQIPDVMLSHHPARAVPERPAPFVQV